MKPGRKRIDPTCKKIMAGYSMSPKVISKIVEIAESKCMSTSSLVETILMDYIEKEGEK